jgi:hypothetical protein
MFVPRHWAQGFINACGAAAPEALALVKALAPVILSIPGQVSGTAAALRLEPLIRRALAAAPESPGAPALRSRDLALGLILLLVKKNRFACVGQVIEAVEQELDARQGILRVLLESARPLDAASGAEFPEELKRSLMKKTGAAGLRLETRVRPELLAGYRLRIGSRVIESSLRLHLRQLGAELAETRPPAPQGGPDWT